jgi:RNA polymerase sigma factor (sigma-70 family)
MEVLSPKEKEVLRLRVKEDRTTREIAEAMNISTRTVEAHLNSIKDIMRAKSQAHMAYIALKAGLIE